MSLKSYRSRGRAHPRSRGEHAVELPQDDGLEGSSPLTRGAPSPMLTEVAERGLIPAHAGSTCPSIWLTPHPGAHPRSRGEHSDLNFIDEGWVGSSPLTRGARRVWYAAGRFAGLIPAHAGSTSISGVLDLSQRAHPRSRGEHFCFAHAGEF